MIRDRGRIKWTSMMLPEHVKLLRDWVAEETYEQEKEIDEQQLELMNEVLAQAMELGQSVTITHYRKPRYELIIGKVHYWNEFSQKIHIIDRFEEVHRIPFKHIADVRLTDE